jgi:predicted HTH domain antitoxin
MSNVTMEPVTTRIPEDQEAILSELEQEMSADRSEVLRRLIRKGLTDWRKEKALDKLREHNITLRRAAEIADVTYLEMLSLAAEEGIDTGYTTDDLERDLGRI